MRSPDRTCSEQQKPIAPVARLRLHVRLSRALRGLFPQYFLSNKRLERLAFKIEGTSEKGTNPRWVGHCGKPCIDIALRIRPANLRKAAARFHPFTLQQLTQLRKVSV